MVESEKHEILERSNDLGKLEVAYQDGEVYIEVGGTVSAVKGVAKASLSLEGRVSLDAVSVVKVAVQFIKDKIPGNIEDGLLDAAVEKLEKL